MWVGWVHHSWRFWQAEALCKVGPKMPEYGSKTSMVPVVWANFGIFRHDPNDFLSRLVTTDKTWLYHYDPETKQQSMELQHSCLARTKKFLVKKICWESSCLDFLGSRRHPPRWLSFKGQNYQCRVLLISAGAIEGYFEGKTQAMGRSPRGSCSCTTMPLLTRHLQPRRNWPTWASNFFITHPILWIWPHWTTTSSLDWKNNWKVAIFHPMRRSLLPWRPGWTDKILNFFWSGLQKLEQWATKCIELRKAYVEKILS